jgi:hypothetical protein
MGSPEVSTTQNKPMLQAMAPKKNPEYITILLPKPLLL